MPPLATADLKRKEPSHKRERDGAGSHEDIFLDAFVPPNSKRHKSRASDGTLSTDLINRDVELDEDLHEGDLSSRPSFPGGIANPTDGQVDLPEVKMEFIPDTEEKHEDNFPPLEHIPCRTTRSSRNSLPPLSYTPAPSTGRNTVMLDDTWNARLDELKAYKEQHGDCLVPKKSRSNPQLGIWVMNQRGELV